MYVCVCMHLIGALVLPLVRMQAYCCVLVYDCCVDICVLCLVSVVSHS